MIAIIAQFVADLIHDLWNVASLKTHRARRNHKHKVIELHRHHKGKP